MIAPVQRICRYALLIEAVKKKTPEGHKDFPLLESALERMKNTVGDINATIKQYESRVRTLFARHSWRWFVALPLFSCAPSLPGEDV